MTERVRHGIELFNRGEFFECHEVLEAEWMPEQGPRRLFLQSLIHVAVGLYHVQRGNLVGAKRQLRKALKKLAGYLPTCEGIDTARLYEDALRILEQIGTGHIDFHAPRIHALAACRRRVGVEGQDNFGSQMNTDARR